MNKYDYLQNIINFCRNFPCNIFEGIVITDDNGSILFVDEKHSAFYGRNPKDEIGHNIKQLNNCKIFSIVLQTGKPIIGKIINVLGKSFIGSTVPIKRGDEIVGAIGIILFTTDETSFRFSQLDNERLNDENICFDDIIGGSYSIKKAKEIALKASQLDLPIILTGETGTGKTIFAKAIHNASPRKEYPFLAINCGAIPKDLFETEFFGYAPGAFSGAHPKGKPGKFEIVNRGTLLLDEISNLPIEFQIKLLDVLQEKKIVRVGGIKSLDIDFRLITATSEDIEKMVNEGRFRSDLYFRINVIRIHLPPLRERKEDIPFLVQYKLEEMRKKYKLSSDSLHLKKDFVEFLTNYSYPGNIRELFNILERIIFNLYQGNEFNYEVLSFKKSETSQGIIPPLKKIVEEAEREAIIKSLRSTCGDVTDAAKILEIHRTTLYKKIDKYKIQLSKSF